MLISLSYECGLMVIFGIGYSLIMVSTFGRAIKAITNLGYDMDLSTTVWITGRQLQLKSVFETVLKYNYSMSAMCGASFYLGMFVGPTLGGVLVERYGFKWTSLIYCLFSIGALILDIAEIVCMICS